MGSGNAQLWSYGNDWRWRVLDNYVIMPITIAGSGTITGLSAGGLPAGSVTAATLASGVGGKILQVVQSTKTDHFTTGSNSYVDVTGTDQGGSGSVWCCKITPAATSSKVLVILSLSMSSADSGQILLKRDSTDIYKGTESVADSDRNCAGGLRQGATNTFNMVGFSYLDSPSSTSELTYKINVLADNSNASDFAINRREVGTEFSFASNLQLMEIAA